MEGSSVPNPVKRDLEKTAKDLAVWFEGKLPRDARDIQISNLSEPGSTGFSSETLLFELGWHEGGESRRESLVMRLEPTGFNIFPSYDVALQFRVMQTLGPTDVPVPLMRWLEEDSSLLGVPFYVMDHVDGTVPTDNPPYHQGGWVFELSPARREALWWSGLEAMGRVHMLDWKALGFESLYEPERGATALEQQLHYYDEYFSWGMDRSGYPVTQAALDYLYANRPADPPVGLCWGDSRLANQIFKDEECVAVIDWEMVHLGSPVEDLAWWIMSDRCFSEALGTERAEGLPSHAETVAHWEAQTGLRAADLGYYEVLALMRFSIHIARIGLQMKYYDVMPQEAIFDSDNLASQTLARKLEELR